MNINLVRNSLEYYDVNREKYQKIVQKIKYVKFVYYSDEIQHDAITAFDENKNILFTSSHEAVGYYNTGTKIWTWAWAEPGLKSGQTYIIGKIFNYARQLPVAEQFLRTELLTSTFRISAKIQLDIHSSIASYLGKQPFLLNYIATPEGENNLIPFTQLKDTEDLEKLSPQTKVFFMFILDTPDLENV